MASESAVVHVDSASSESQNRVVESTSNVGIHAESLIERKRTHNDDEDDDGHTSDGDGRRDRYKRPALHDAEKGNDGIDGNGPSGSIIRDENGDINSVSDGVRNDHSSYRIKSDDVGTGIAAANAVAPSSMTISMRALVTTKEAGVVIGKAGKSIAEIRERTGARVNVSEMVPGAVERIITVMGAIDQIAKAYSLVASKIIEEAQASAATTGVRPPMTATLRLLISHGRMGSIIGKGGAKIKEIQDNSGARMLATEEILPHSTERTLTVSGVPDAIHIAVYHVGLILQESPDRSGAMIYYKPQVGGLPSLPSVPRGPHGHNPHGGFGGPQNPYGHPAFYGPGPGQASIYGGGGGYGVPTAPAYGGAHGSAPGAAYGQPLPPGVTTQQIYIPGDLVGCIIGKGGSKINEIRQLSSAHIKISDAVGSTAERLVTITGTPEANQMALYLLYSKLESEKPRYK